MAEFFWRAADASGQVNEGRLEASSAAVAARQLRDRGLVPVTLREGGRSGNAISGGQIRGRSSMGPQRGKGVLPTSSLTGELAIAAGRAGAGEC
jgi:general secretion pathway protein F